MIVRIQGKQLKVPEELKQYVQDRLVVPLTRFYDDSAAELRVQFGDTNGPKGGNDKECHLTLYMPGTSAIQIEETTPDLYASLDAASDRLIRICKREIARMRTQTKHTKYRPLATVAAEGGVPAGPIEDLERIKDHEPPPVQAAIHEARDEPLERSLGEYEEARGTEL
jgi:putative sigma-54 modulation protein